MTDLRLELPDGCVVLATEAPHSPVVDLFFEGYDRAFILPDEREELSGFRECLAQNDGPLASAFGRKQRETVAALLSPDGVLLGGANFFSTGRAASTLGPRVSANLNYVYVEREARGQGVLRKLLEATRVLAQQAHGLEPGEEAPAIFLEQNDPLRLSAKEYAEDTAHSGTDQIERLSIWAHLGARLLDHAYVQPALSFDREPEEGLLYAALSFPRACVPAHYLHEHLESFFGVSVLKGRPLELDAAASKQLHELEKSNNCLELLPFGEAARSLKGANGWPKSGSFLEFVKHLR